MADARGGSGGGTLASNRSLSRLEARLALELAVERRYPRVLPRKPVLAGSPLDLYALHQTVLRLGGYRRVRRH